MSSQAPLESPPAKAQPAEPRAPAAERPAKGPRGKVVIFGTWCKECGICAAFCPTGVLALNDEGHLVVVHPEKCSACHWCDTHCPDLAILVTRIEG